MKLKDIQKEKTNKTKFASVRIKPENFKWFKDNKIDMDKMIEHFKKLTHKTGSEVNEK